MLQTVKGLSIMKRNAKIEWIWEGLIPRGYITILASRGGVGKSGFALWLSDYLTEKEFKVLYVDAERCGRHINQRTSDWCLQNSNNIYFTMETLNNGAIETAPPKDNAQLMATVKEIQPDLVVLDSLTVFARVFDSNKREAIARYFGEITSIATEGNTAVLLLAHTKKKQMPEEELNLDSIAGSAAISDLARSVLLMDKGDTEEERIITQVKSNFSKPSQPIIFNLTEKGIRNIGILKTSNSKRETGSKAERYRQIASIAFRKGLNQKEIRAELVLAGATSKEHQRAIDYITEKYSITWA